MRSLNGWATMPLVKRGAPAAPEAAQRTEKARAPALTGLTNPDSEIRWRAARALSEWPETVPALAAALDAEQVPRVREAIMTALMRIGDKASVKALLPCLRSQDAAVRAGALDALQAIGDAILPFLQLLLADTDSDVRILATELARSVSPADATAILCRLLEQERHPNVCAAAMEILAEVGTREAVPALRACADRFSDISFLTFAASAAIARIADAKT
jgi:HEAT repeat protein